MHGQSGEGRATGQSQDDAGPVSIVADLLRRQGITFAEECRIHLADEPVPLFQLLVMTLLMSKRIAVRHAVQATRALFAAGWTTPTASKPLPTDGSSDPGY
jgi:hypothetical protein